MSQSRKSFFPLMSFYLSSFSFLTARHAFLLYPVPKAGEKWLVAVAFTPLKTVR